MKNTDISQLFGVPFGAQADSTTIAAIPASKTAIGRASMALGFPKENFQSLDNGGQPVSGADLNGILNTLARSAQAAELGVQHPFSASYAEAIGGYPAGATVTHPTITGRLLICTQDGNTNDPSVNMAGWDDPIGNFATQLDNETVSNNYNIPSNGQPALGLWSDANGQPQYTDAANGTRALMLKSTSTSASSASSSGYRLLNRQVWAKGGSYTYTPTAGTTHIIVKLCGAGGGGGGAQPQQGYTGAGAGGSGGTYAETNLLSVPTGTIAVTVGLGGAGGLGGTSIAKTGGNGGVSSFGSIVTCPGGIGGAFSELIDSGYAYNLPLTPPPGPATGNALITIMGGYSSVGLSSGSGYAQATIGCAGGSSFFGAGAPALIWTNIAVYADPLNYTNAGINGVSPGSGGGGGAYYMSANSPTSGGNGADGIVIVEEYC